METLREILLYSTLINFGLLGVWVLVFLVLHDWTLRLAERIGLRLAREQYDAINFAGIVFYKSAILLFNLAPYLAMRFVG